MKKQNNIVLLTALVIFNLIFTNCEKTSKSIQTDKFENFHIKSIGKELELLSKALIPVIQNKRNVEIIKEAIYQKKRDENITLKDLFNFHNGLITKPGFGNERVISLEQQILDNINQYQAMTLDELRSLIETYDMSLYWEFIQLWDGTTQPQVGYPTNEEEDVNHDYDLMAYKVFTSPEDVTGMAVIRNYIKDNPVILIRPLENFENGGEAYYGGVDYVWLGDIIFNDYNNSGSNIKETNSAFKVQNFTERCRVYAIHTSGKTLDGSGGPEFRFFRKDFYDAANTGLYSFSEIAYLNLTSSVAAQSGPNNWIKVSDYTNNILDELWLFYKWEQDIGTYEQDGGTGTKTITGLVVEAIGEIGSDFLPFNLSAITFSGNISISTKIQSKDDLLDKYKMSWLSFVYHVKERNDWGWGFYNDAGTNLPIRFTDNADLKVVYKNY